MPELLQKHTIFLNKGDYDKLGSLYPELKASAIIRRLVENYLKAIETKSTPGLQSTETQL